MPPWRPRTSDDIASNNYWGGDGSAWSTWPSTSNSDGPWLSRCRIPIWWLERATPPPISPKPAPVAGLDHPNLVTVHDVGGTPEFPFFVVSKYIEGSALKQRLKQARPSVLEA